MHPFAGLDGDRPRPRLAGSVARSARPVPAPALLRHLEPLAAVFCGLHGVIVLAGAGRSRVAVGRGRAGPGARPGRPRRARPGLDGPAAGGSILVDGVALQGSAGGAGGWFAVWPFVLVAVYPLANLAIEAELELGRRERLGKALLDALTDPTSVLDAQGRIVAANQAWVRFAATDLAGLEPAANGVRAVLAGEASLFRCRYQARTAPGPTRSPSPPWPRATAPSSATGPHRRR